jgi:hypothetical protein
MIISRCYVGKVRNPFTGNFGCHGFERSTWRGCDPSHPGRGPPGRAAGGFGWRLIWPAFHTSHPVLAAPRSRAPAESEHRRRRQRHGAPRVMQGAASSRSPADPGDGPGPAGGSGYHAPGGGGGSAACDGGMAPRTWNSLRSIVAARRSVRRCGRHADRRSGYIRSLEPRHWQVRSPLAGQAMPVCGGVAPGSRPCRPGQPGPCDRPDVLVLSERAVRSESPGFSLVG